MDAESLSRPEFFGGGLIFIARKCLPDRGHSISRKLAYDQHGAIQSVGWKYSNLDPMYSTMARMGVLPPVWRRHRIVVRARTAKEGI